MGPNMMIFTQWVTNSPLIVNEDHISAVRPLPDHEKEATELILIGGNVFHVQGEMDILFADEDDEEQFNPEHN